MPPTNTLPKACLQPTRSQKHASNQHALKSMPPTNTNTQTQSRGPQQEMLAPEQRDPRPVQCREIVLPQSKAPHSPGSAAIVRQNNDRKRLKLKHCSQHRLTPPPSHVPAQGWVRPISWKVYLHQHNNDHYVRHSPVTWTPSIPGVSPGQVLPGHTIEPVTYQPVPRWWSRT